MNYLKGLLVRDGEEGGEEEILQPAPSPAEVEQLTQDELRRRRMARLEASASSPSVAATASTTTAAAAGNEEEEEKGTRVPKRIQTVAPPVVMAAAAAAAEKSEPTPKRSQTELKPPPQQNLTNQALVQLLRISLSPKSVVPQTLYLAQVAEECGTGLLSEENLDAALCGRMYLDPNDFDPRPTESPLVYVMSCLQRLPGMLRQFENQRSVLDQAKQLLINFVVTYLMEPSLFPSSCLAKSSATGPCEPVQEVLDLLKRPDTSSNMVYLLITIFPEVQSQKCGKEIMLTWLQQLSQAQKQNRNELLETVLSQLCCARANKSGWGHFLAEIVQEERERFVATTTAAGNGRTGRNLFEPQSFGAKFEHESILAPFFASIGIHFEGEEPIRQTVMDAKRATVSTRLKTLSSAVLELCKTDEFTRNEIMGWLEFGLEMNEERTKDRPVNSKCSSDSMVFSITHVLLELCGPFLVQEKSLSTLPVLQQEASEFIAQSKAFPTGETKLFRNTDDGNDEKGKLPSTKKFKFQTRAFALALRAINLGPVVAYRRLKLLQRNFHHFRHELGDNDPQIKLLGKQITTLVATAFEPSLLLLLLQFESLVSRWLSAALSDDSQWKLLPEFVVSDLPEIFVQIGQVDAHQLETCGVDVLRFVSDFFIQAIGFDQIVAHVRAPMGDALFWAFLPEEAKQFDQQQQQQPQRFSASSRQLCLESNLAQTHLVPALMKLYGDVQVTGFYQVSAHRQLITKLLSYLWKISLHRQAFREFAETSAVDESDSAFIKFANGILNQTNSNVAESLAKLREIRKIQLEQKTPAWTSELTEEERKQKLTLLEANEKEVASCLMMANDATDMLAYLSSDRAFVKAFTVPTLRSRLVDMLSSILGSLGSKKNAEFKIDQPEKYNFFPKKMLREIFQTLLHCSSSGSGSTLEEEEQHQLFVASVARSAYFNKDTFMNAELLVRKHGLAADAGAEMDKFKAFVEECELAKRQMEQEDEDLGEVPEDFLDPLMQTLMTDPVILPGSKVTVDRETIVHHLLQNGNDPFDRSPLELSQILPNADIRDRIAAWRIERRSKQ